MDEKKEAVATAPLSKNKLLTTERVTTSDDAQKRTEKITKNEEFDKGTKKLEDMKEAVVTIPRKDLDRF